MARKYSYETNFDASPALQGASSITTGDNVGLGSYDGDPADSEYYLFTGSNEYAKLQLNSGLTENLTTLTASMQLVINKGNNNKYGNGQPDGTAFSYGLPSSIANGSDGEGINEGVHIGLSIRINPYEDYYGIYWNGAEVARDGLGLGTSRLDSPNIGPQELYINVAENGFVSVIYGKASLAGKIPGTEWQDTDQDGWDFVVSGRTGGNSGTAFIDDVNVNGRIICFAAGTLIRTPEKEVSIESLRVGNLVITRDNGPQPIRWIGRSQLSGSKLALIPNLRPIRIRAGALGKNTPKDDLIVSPQHRVLVRSKVAQRMFNAGEVLIAAKYLLENDGIEVAEDMTEVEYFHILFDRHEVVFSNGAETESLHTGPEAIKSLSRAVREEIFTLFPELQNSEMVRSTARPLISGRMGRQLVMRHNKNKHELVY